MGIVILQEKQGIPVRNNDRANARIHGNGLTYTSKHTFQHIPPKMGELEDNRLMLTEYQGCLSPLFTYTGLTCIYIMLTEYQGCWSPLFTYTGLTCIYLMLTECQCSPMGYDSFEMFKTFATNLRIKLCVQRAYNILTAIVQRLPRHSSRIVYIQGPSRDVV